MPQRIAEQWMVIGNDEVGAGSGSHLVLAKGCGKTRDRFLGQPSEFSPAIVHRWAAARKRPYCLAAKRLISRRLCDAIG
jgi:hypothetical protein